VASPPPRALSHARATAPQPSSAAPTATMSSALAFSASVAARPVAVAARRAASSKARRAVSPRAEVDRGYGPGSAAVSTEDLYEVTLPKPIGVKFVRGNDGGAYVAFVPPNDPKYEVFEIGDKIEGVSASFGDEVWPAESFGQVMYAMKNRNGDIYLKMKKMFGDFSAMEVEKNSQFKSERAGGNYGAGTKEQQMNNYSKKRELENERLDMFDEAIALYNQKNFDDALIQFEEVAALEPKNYMSDNFETTTEIYRVCQYNIACCFSNIGKLDESLLALRRCMASGWTDYRKIRTDPSLKNVRTSPEFTPLMNKFDEPIFNENAAKFLGNLFGKK
jgi:hypothetical protein